MSEGKTHLMQSSYVLTEVASQSRQVLLLPSVGACQVSCYCDDSNEGVVLKF